MQTPLLAKTIILIESGKSTINFQPENKIFKSMNELKASVLSCVLLETPTWAIHFRPLLKKKSKCFALNCTFSLYLFPNI